MVSSPRSEIVTIVSSGEEEGAEEERGDDNEISVLRESHSSDKDSCSICLGGFTNRSFLNECFHAFCYYCILQWSEVSQTCPLCKKTFSKIIHDVTSIRTYKETMVRSERAVQLPPEVRNSFRPVVRYRTTQTTFRGGEEVEEEVEGPPVDRVVVRHRGKRRRRNRPKNEEEIQLQEKRQEIYSTNRWAQPLEIEPHRRMRRTSPSFYVQFEGAKHRLFHFIRNDLEVLLLDRAERVNSVIERIWKLLDKHHIKSEAFQKKVQPHLGDKTDHFCHELYMFAISPYDWKSYLRRVEYGEGRSRWDSSPVRYIGHGGGENDTVANTRWDDEDVTCPQRGREGRRGSDSSVEIIEKDPQLVEISGSTKSPILIDKEGEEEEGGECPKTPVFIDLDNIPATPTPPKSPLSSDSSVRDTSPPRVMVENPTPKRSASSGKGKEKRKKRIVLTPDLSPIKILMDDSEPCSSKYIT